MGDLAKETVHYRPMDTNISISTVIKLFLFLRFGATSARKPFSTDVWGRCRSMNIISSITGEVKDHTIDIDMD